MYLPENVRQEADATVKPLPAIKPKAEAEKPKVEARKNEKGDYNYTITATRNATVKITNEGIVVDGKQILAFDPHKQWRHIEVVTPDNSRTTVDVSEYNDKQHSLGVHVTDISSPTIKFGTLEKNKGVTVTVVGGQPVFEVLPSQIQNVRVKHGDLGFAITEKGDHLDVEEQVFTFGGSGRDRNQVALQPGVVIPGHEHAMVVTFNIVEGSVSKPIKTYFGKIPSDESPRAFRSDEAVQAGLIAAAQEVAVKAGRKAAQEKAGKGATPD